MESGTEFWHYQWIFWMVFGLAMWGMFGRGGWACNGKSRRRRHSRASQEVDQLKAELDASQQQIAALKRRLEAVETIVTDEEAQLRREFDQLREDPAR